MDWLKKYLLASAAYHMPPGEEGADGGEGEVDTGTEAGGDEPAGEDQGESPEGAGDDVDAEGEDEEEVDATPAPKKGRASETIRELRARVQHESAERQRIDRELADLRAAERARQQQNQQETPEARAARRALMDPMEVMREDLRESEQRTQHLLRQQAAQAQETGDKLEYGQLLRENPHWKKFDAEVEKVRLEQQANGMFVPRRVLLELAIGRAAMAQAAKTSGKAKSAGQRQVAAAQSRPAGSKGDTATQRGKQGDSPEKRLEGVPI